MLAIIYCMGAGRRHKTPGFRDQGQFITFISSTRVSSFSGTSSPSLGSHGTVQCLPGLGYTEEESQAEEPESFVIVFEQTCSLA